MSGSAPVSNHGPIDIQQRFELLVASNPHAVALTAGGQWLTCGELNHRANQVARLLCSAGVTREQRIALWMDRSPSMYTMLLGIVKSGAAYVHVSPRLPVARQRLLIDQCRPLLAIHDADVVVAAAAGSVRLVASATIERAMAGEPTDDFESGASPNDLFSIIYTSGTTGFPKGVMVTRGAVTNQIDGLLSRVQFMAGDVALLHRAPDITGATWDLFGPLVCGVPSVVVDEFQSRNAAVLARRIVDDGVSVLAAAPSLLDVLLRHAERASVTWSRIRLCITGGEMMPSSLARRWAQVCPNGKFLNIYGAAECLYIASHEVSPADQVCVPVGTTLSNVTVRLADSRGASAAAGDQGEIHVGGAGIARGYLDDPCGTASSFIPDADSAYPGARAYRTGDLGVLNAHGELEVSGRTDSQLKVLGRRVELEEVEAALCRVSGIDASAAVIKADANNHPRIAAFIVRSADAPLLDKLRSDIMCELPNYLVPADIVELESLPLSRSGKIDRVALSAVEISHSRSVRGVPASDTEKVLASIWRSILGRDDVGVDDHFFEFGGDSLQSMRVLSEIEDQTGIEIGLEVFFGGPTIRHLATVVDAKRPA